MCELFAWLGVFVGECEDKQCYTLVDNALSVNSPLVTVCVQCAHTCSTRPCPVQRALSRGARLRAFWFCCTCGWGSFVCDL